MKEILAFLLLCQLAGPLLAEPRLMEIRPGSPCERIAQLEERLGSVVLSAQDGDGISKYRGTQGGVETTVVYHCDQGRLTRQQIIFTSATGSSAYRIADEQRGVLAAKLGEPVHDGLNLPTWRKLLYGFLGADLDYLTSVVVWGRADEDFMLLLRDAGEKGWEIIISQGNSKSEYILNS